MAGKPKITTLLQSTTVGEGNAHQPWGSKKTFQLVGVMSSSTGTGVVDIEVSNDGTNFIVLGTVTLALTTTASTDGFFIDNNWKYVRGNVKTLTTDGTLTLTMGNEVG